MLEYIATVVGMQQVDEVLLAKAQDKETNRAQIVQTVPFSTCSYKDHKKIKECFDAKSKLQEKNADVYQDMWNKDWINSP